MAAPERWLDDFQPGETAAFGAIPITEADILDFARRYDPQPFHTDARAARESVYGGLIASGWHTTAVTMAMLVRQFVPANASLGSPGVDELRWLKPVRPGDTLGLSVTVEAVQPSRSRPDRGILRMLMETLNQQGEVVMSMRAMLLLRRRPGLDS